VAEMLLNVQSVSPPSEYISDGHKPTIEKDSYMVVPGFDTREYYYFKSNLEKMDSLVKNGPI
jgi:hypothetical protein